MPWKITHEPRNRITGVTPNTFEVETAQEAWRQVSGLEMSDERCTQIVAPNGQSVTSQHLRDWVEGRIAKNSPAALE